MNIAATKIHIYSFLEALFLIIQNLETKKFMKSQVDEQIMVYLWNEMPLRNKKQWTVLKQHRCNIDTCYMEHGNIMDKSQKHYAEQKKRREHTLYDSVYNKL